MIAAATVVAVVVVWAGLHWMLGRYPRRVLLTPSELAMRRLSVQLTESSRIIGEGILPAMERAAVAFAALNDAMRKDMDGPAA